MNQGADVDKRTDMGNITNCMIGACYDTKGQLRGAVQLFNKQSSEPIGQMESDDFQSLLTTVAEMIKHADDVKQTMDLNNNIMVSLHESNKLVSKGDKVVESTEIREVNNCLRSVVG